MKCTFCGGTQGLRAAPIIPSWFPDHGRTGAREFSSYELIDVRALMDRDMSSSSVIGRVHGDGAAGRICSRCEEGWSRRLEEEAREPFSTMVGRRFPDDPSALAVADYVRIHAEVGAKVAFRTALLLDADTPRRVIPDQHYRVFGRAALPDGACVDLGFCRQPSPLRALIGPVESERGSLSRCAYRFTFQCGQLVLMLRHTMGRPYDLHPGTIKLYPEFEIGEDLKVYEDALDIITWDVLAQAHFNEKAGNVFYGMLG